MTPTTITFRGVIAYSGGVAGGLLGGEPFLMSEQE